MNYEQFNIKLKSQIAELSYAKQIKFSLTICKRLFFDYEVFSKKNGWGEPNTLLDAIIYVDNNDAEHYNIEEINYLFNAVMAVTPDTEDFEECSYALNAACALLELLEFVRDKNWDHVYSVSTMLTDTVDFQIFENDDVKLEQVDQHPLMIETRNLLLNLTR
jgi:uncharacterized protein YjaG (DUF416 family)